MQLSNLQSGFDTGKRETCDVTYCSTSREFELRAAKSATAPYRLQFRPPLVVAGNVFATAFTTPFLLTLFQSDFGHDHEDATRPIDRPRGQALLGEVHHAQQVRRAPPSLCDSASKLYSLTDASSKVGP